MTELIDTIIWRMLAVFTENRISWTTQNQIDYLTAQLTMCDEEAEKAGAGHEFADVYKQALTQAIFNVRWESMLPETKV